MHKLGRAVSLKRLRGYSIAIIVVLLLGVSVLVIHLGVLDQLASSISSFGGATTTVFFMPYGEESLSPGGITSIDVNINTKVPINALGATISFPKESFDIVGISKEKSFFNLWTEDTTIAEGLGEIRFSGGTTKRGGVMGTGTVFTITVRAKGSGSAELQFKNVQVFPSSNTGQQLDTETRAITYSIQEQKTNSGGAGNSSTSPPATTPNVDVNGDGKVNLIDLSILTFKMFGTYDPRYDFNMNGSVGLDDISILLSKL